MTFKMDDQGADGREDVPLLGETAPVTHLNSLKQQIPSPSCRVVFAVTCFLGFVNVYALRVNLSVALVAMVNSSYAEVNNSTSNECPGEKVENATKIVTGEFNWDSELQGYILGAFFYGYICTQVLGGRMAELFGGKLLYGVGILCTAVLTLLTPLAARASPYLFIALRVLEGFGEGVTFPAMHSILSRWAPPLERSKMGTFIYAGAQMGTVVSMPLSGVISEKLGWDYVFYIFGALGCIWFIAYLFLVYDCPAQHPRISREELHYIETAIGPHVGDKKCPVPWFSIFTSVPFWACATAHFTFNWGFYTLLTSLPKYMSDVLHFNISANGLLSALPYLFMWMLIVLGGQLADTLIEKQVLSRTVVRKLANTLGQCVPAVCLVIVSYLGCDPTLAVVMLTVAGAGCGFSMAGYNVNHLDLAPRYAGTMMGLTNTIATIPGFLAPEVVGWITQDNPTAGRWQIVFFISAGAYLFGALIFGIFASGERQKWADPPDILDEYDEEIPSAQVPRSPNQRFNPFNRRDDEERSYVQ